MKNYSNKMFKKQNRFNFRRKPIDVMTDSIFLDIESIELQITDSDSGPKTFKQKR